MPTLRDPGHNSTRLARYLFHEVHISTTLLLVTGLPLIPLSSLEYLQMPRLLRKHLLCIAYEPGAALVLDLVLCDDGRFLGLDDAGAGLFARDRGPRVPMLVYVLGEQFALGGVLSAGRGRTSSEERPWSS